MSAKTSIQWCDRTGRSLGALKTAAKRCGVSLDEYQQRREQGLKRCTDCGVWKDSAVEFRADRTRSDGVSARCASCSNERGRAKYEPRGRVSRKGIPLAPTRDGDRKQARARVNHAVAIGSLPRPNDLPCADCGHVYSPGERRHEYDHHLGYGAAFQTDVQAVCTTCHHEREARRRG